MSAGFRHVAPPAHLSGQARALLTDVVEPAVFGGAVAVELSARHLPGEPVAYADAVSGDFAPFAVGASWGPQWGTTWFRVRAVVPLDSAGDEVALRWEATPPAEGLVWRHGAPLVGLSWLRRDVVLLPRAHGGEVVDVFVEAAANPAVPPHDAGIDWPLLLPDPGGLPRCTLDRAELAVRRRPVYDLACDLRTVLQLGASGAEPDGEVLDALAAVVGAVDPDDVPGTAAAGRAALASVLARPAAQTPVGGHRVTAVGHAHLDTAWLWPMRETVRKCARSFANAVTLMEEYPEFGFVCSAARHLAWVEERFPALFARIRERVATGQFQPVGGMWVEADCNLPSGESLVRQFVHGQRWYLSRFGRECREAWLPDGFGFPATLPQILAEAGMGWFVSQKLSWNDTNRFPYRTFWWQGLDGTRVRAHFPPADTYNGDMSLVELARGTAEPGRSLYPFGYGDGGGGPTRDMVEAARRAADLAGAPQVAMEPLAAFFAAVEADPSPLPVWDGELYLEKHRGTFTSQAATKLANRRDEMMLAAAELWSTVRPDAAPWPAEELDGAWKLLLVNQFHDVLPGSSIHWVYQDAAADHAAVQRVAARLVDDALEAVAGAMDTSAAAEPILVCNGTPFPRREVVDAGTRLVMADVPSMGYAVVDAGRQGAGTDAPAIADERGMSNGHLAVEWDAEGRLTSLWDADHGRAVLAPCRAGNVFHLHHDRPAEYDAWDVDRSYLDDFEEPAGPVAPEVVESSGLRAAVRFRRSFGASTLTQTLVLQAGSRRLDFVTEVDWHECHTFLKVAFPVAVHADRATYEVQFGHVSRSTGENTSWEKARFEVCAHRWADLSEAGYGVALLNDCKYGYDVRVNVLRLSLLRSPTAPDPLCDQGRHRFTYALLPHAGDATAGGVIEAAAALNAPLVVRGVASHTGPLPPSNSYVSAHGAAFVVTAVKRADDGTGDVVVRGYEAHGRGGAARVHVSLPFTRAARTDLLERPRHELAVDGPDVLLRLRPFELVTFRLS